VLLRYRVPCLGLAAAGALLLAAPALLDLGTGEVSNQELGDGTIVTIETPPDTVLDGAVTMTAWLGGLAVLLGGLAGLLARSQTLRVSAVAASWAILFVVALSAWREFDARERGFRGMAAAMRTAGDPGDPVAVYRKRLPSVTWYLGRPVAWPHDPAALGAVLDAPGRAWVIARERHGRTLLEPDAAGAPGPLGGRLAEVSRSGEWVLFRER
jgi:hypothetical protein